MARLTGLDPAGMSVGVGDLRHPLRPTQTRRLLAHAMKTFITILAVWLAVGVIAGQLTRLMHSSGAEEEEPLFI